MTGAHTYRLPLLSVLTGLLLIRCQPKAEEKFTLKRSYHYTIIASIGGNPINKGFTQFELRPRNRRRWKFHLFPEKPNAIMYAYQLTSRYDYNDKLQREVVSHDTIEAAVTKPQADSLFSLAKKVFEAISVSNIDTVYTEEKVTYFETDDVRGMMGIDSRYGNMQINIGELHTSSNRQATPFLALCKEFETLFPEKK